jgi:ion channel POLLUX/CASTOR
MRRFSWRERARYAFDNSMARGTPALVAVLAAATLAMLVLYVALVLATGLAGEAVENPTLPRLLWFALMRAMDAGAVGADTGSWPFLLSDLAISVGGIFVLSSLIGVLSAGLQTRLEELRRGRSHVVETGHTVVLGWSPSVFAVVGELVVANQNRRRAVIVVLADRDKAEMEDALRERLPDTGGTRIVCRSGRTSDPASLDVAGVPQARAVIVLAPEGDDPDVDVLKTLLAITHGPGRRPEPYHVVAEITEPSNLGAAKLIAGDEVELVCGGDLISRITVQTCRQSGLSVVHSELLDFAGNEIYFAPADALAGRSFGEALHAYRRSAVIGLVRGGGVRVLPPMDLVIAPGDQIIAVSEDDDTLRIDADVGRPDASAIVAGETAAQGPERTLILGWNWRAPSIVAGLEAYVAEGSEVLVVAEGDHAEALSEVAARLTRQALRYQRADTTSRPVLESLDVARYDHVVLLCAGDVPAERADARVLVTLLQLRDMGRKRGRAFSVVSEMRDVRNRELAEVTQADDFIVSDRLVSLMLCQVAENKQLNAVLSELFDPEGAEIYLKPAGDYVKLGAALDFHTVVEAARMRGEAAIGYRRASRRSEAREAYGVVLNPDKRAPVSFEAGDKVIVVATS